MTVTVRSMRPDDWSAVERIYREGIATGNATFEDEPPNWDEFDASHVTVPRLVAVDDGTVIGWAAGTRTSSRCVYEGVIENSVYVAADARGRGVGVTLLTAFLRLAERSNVWTVQAGVFPENDSSMALHERLGFRVLGVRERVGKMSYGPHVGQWRDVAILEYRSANVGID